MSATDVYFFGNGNTAVTDGSEQLPELQKSWLLLFVQFLESQGVDPLKITFHFPSGQDAWLFKTDEGHNWRFQR